MAQANRITVEYSYDGSNYGLIYDLYTSVGGINMDMFSYLPNGNNGGLSGDLTVWWRLTCYDNNGLAVGRNTIAALSMAR